MHISIRRCVLATGILAGLFLSAAPITAQAQARYEFNLPSEPLADSLRAVGSRAGVDIAFDEAVVRGKTAPALQGNYSPSEALERLIRGTGLTIHATKGGSFVVERRSSTASRAVTDAGESPGQPAPLPGTPMGESDQAPKLSEVIVTGTSIRGLITPVGAPTATIGTADVQATGATDMVDLLSSVPQISTFGTTPHGNAKATQSFDVPSLRNLTTQQGDGTLFLFNGVRMVGGGFSTRPDPAVIPPGAVQRVDVVLGGGSAVYGSDAVAGTLDFILRRTLNGAEVNATYGGANNYRTYDVNGALGKVWDTGNVLVTFDYADNTDLLGRYRDYFTNDNTVHGGSDFRLTFCNAPNITIGKTTYAYPALAPNTRNVCDPSENTDLYPEEVRRSALISFNQQIVPNLEFGFDAYISYRTDEFASQPSSAKGTILASNPYFTAPPSLPSATSESLAFNFGDVFGNQTITGQEYETWQYVPSLKWSIGDGWQATGTINVGKGYGIVHQPSVNAGVIKTALAGTSTATALDPYDLSQTDPSVLASIQDYNQYDERIHKMMQDRLVFDGPVWQLPAGTVRLAVGGERYFESQWSISDAGPFGQEVAYGGRPAAYGSYAVNSAFGEMVIPVIGGRDALPGVRSLTFDLSGRYDKYTNFGHTSNPRLALNWRPLEDLVIRGDYSTAFVAPSLNSTTKPEVADITATTATLVPPGGTSNRPEVILQGGNPDLQPETAKIYDLGFDWDPQFLSGLSVSATYYNIHFSNLIGGPSTSNADLFFTTPGYARFYVVNPSAAQLGAFVGNLPHSPDVPLDFYGAPQIVIDSRTQNLGTVFASGLDYSLRYIFHTRYGSIVPAVSGTHGLRLDSQTPTGAPFVNNFDNGYSQDELSASLSYGIGRVISRLTWDYLGGFPIQGIADQTRVSAFETLNLYASYELPERGLTRGTTISFHCDNIFDRSPAYENIAGGFGNGSTFGRLLSVTLQKKF